MLLMVSSMIVSDVVDGVGDLHLCHDLSGDLPGHPLYSPFLEPLLEPLFGPPPGHPPGHPPKCPFLATPPKMAKNGQKWPILATPENRGNLCNFVSRPVFRKSGFWPFPKA